MTPTIDHLTELLARVDANIARMAAVLDPEPETAETVTQDKLHDLADLLYQSSQTIRRCRLQAEAGDIAPSEAADTVKDVVETINRFCRP